MKPPEPILIKIALVLLWFFFADGTAGLIMRPVSAVVLGIVFIVIWYVIKYIFYKPAIH